MSLMTVAAKSCSSSGRSHRIAALLIVVLSCSSVHATPRPDDTAPLWSQTRALTAGTRELLVDAAARSSIIGRLLADLERSDLVVYLTDMAPWTANGPPSYLSFLSRDENTRYLLIRIDRFKLSPHERIMWLGHELQHALEVAAAPEVRDSAGLARLYRRIGWESTVNRFETQAAKAMSQRVKDELQGRRS